MKTRFEALSELKPELVNVIWRNNIERYYLNNTPERVIGKSDIFIPIKATKVNSLDTK